jgi:site-specific recombinase XerD
MESRVTYSTTFIIRTARTSNGEVPIYCRITVNSARSEFSIKRSVLESQWDNGKVKGNNEAAKALNSYLKQIEARIFEHYREMLAAKQTVTSDALKNAYLGLGAKEHSLQDLVEYHNNYEKQRLEWGSIKNHFTTQKYITRFLKEKYKMNDIFLSQLQFKFLTDFEMFLRNQKPVGCKKACGNNTVMKHIERLKKIVNMAVQNEWLEKDPFAKFKKSFTKYTRGYLTEDELTAIENKQFTIARLQQVKDLFVFSCYTGLAYIDVMKLTPSDIRIGIDKEYWLFTSREKTDTSVKVPLLPKALQIIEKYKEHPTCLAHGTLFPSISNQRLNSYLKEIADLCGITKNLTFHLARHTFATTVTLTNGVPMETVSKLLGHSSIRTTQIYAKVVERKVSEDMQALKEKLKGVETYNTSRKIRS